MSAILSRSREQGAGGSFGSTRPFAKTCTKTQAGPKRSLMMTFKRREARVGAQLDEQFIAQIFEA